MPVSRRGFFAAASKLALGAAAFPILDSLGAAAAHAGAIMPPLSAETAGRYADLGYDPQQVYAVFHSVQQAFKAKDAAKLSGLVSFPMLLKTPDSSTHIKTAEELYRHRDVIFSDAVRNIVLAQEFETLFLSSNGMMFGDGQIWLEAICPDQACATSVVQIVTINLIN